MIYFTHKYMKFLQFVTSILNFGRYFNRCRSIGVILGADKNFWWLSHYYGIHNSQTKQYFLTIQQPVLIMILNAMTWVLGIYYTIILKLSHTEFVVEARATSHTTLLVNSAFNLPSSPYCQNSYNSSFCGCLHLLKIDVIIAFILLE